MRWRTGAYRWGRHDRRTWAARHAVSLHRISEQGWRRSFVQTGESDVEQVAVVVGAVGLVVEMVGVPGGSGSLKEALGMKWVER